MAVCESVCWLLGATFLTLAALGILKFPDVLCRCHALTKAATLGISFLLIGAGFHLGFDGPTAFKVGLALVFQWITIPVSGHLVARLAYHRDIHRWKKSPLQGERP
jgi:multicomponent Na+:H+ antiporter subunit G